MLQIPISTGTIQNIIDRNAEALLPVYDRIGRIARSFWCNYVDETSWFKENGLQWLWAMVNERVAFYRIDPHRSKAAFELLIQDWQGILVSDGYGLYRKWVNRQTCLAHLIRKADALAERKKVDAQFKEALKILPEKKEIPSLLITITRLGLESNLIFRSFTPGAESGKDFYASIPVSIAVTGKYHDVAVFFDKVGKMERIVNILNVNMSPKGSLSTDLNTTCKAVTYMFKK